MTRPLVTSLSSMFRVADFRMRFVGGIVRLYVDTIGGGSLAGPISGARAGAMLEVFNTRECYWDPATASLLTDPTLSSVVEDPAPQQLAGTVSSWEVRIPATGQAMFYVGLVPERTMPTSGDLAVSRKTIAAPDDDAILAILNLLGCSYAFYDSDGSVRNSEIDVVP